MRDYVVLYINNTSGDNREHEEVLKKFAEFRIKYKVIDLTGKLDLYGNEASLEGFFATDFSGLGPDVSVPVTPFAVAHSKSYSGSREILDNLEYFKQHYVDTSQ